MNNTKVKKKDVTKEQYSSPELDKEVKAKTDELVGGIKGSVDKQFDPLKKLIKE